MLNKKHILSLMEPGLDGDDCFLVDLTIAPGNAISVEIDGFNGVNITKCVEISRLIEHNLDRDEEDFSLNVATPGLDQSFKHEAQYRKNVGRQVVVKLMTGHKLQGELKEVEDEIIKVETKEKVRVEGRKKKEWVTTLHEIEKLNIAETKVVISFK